MAGDDDPLRRVVGELSVIREVFDRLPLMLAGFRGPEHRFVAVNAALRAFLGDHPVVGRPARDVLPEIEGHVVLEALDRVYRTGEPESGREWRVALARERGDTPRERYLDFTAVPDVSAGAITGVMVHARDVSARVRGRREMHSQVALSGAAARYRDVEALLQEALLPPGLPVLPGVALGCRYLGAESDQAAGGDWFDAVPLDGGRIALMVGDVVGHGVPASAVMGQLRAVLADQLADGAGLDDLVRRAQRFAERNPAARAATICAAVLDPATGLLSYVTCGHPAPLVVSLDGSTRFLPPSGGVPLGANAEPSVAEAVLAAGEVLLLYTDGLVERPGVPLAAGQAELAALAADLVADRGVPRYRPVEPIVQRVCTQAVEMVSRQVGVGDDVTVLGVQRRGAPVEVFEQDMPARAGLLSLLRQRLEAWLRGLGASSDDLFSAQIAVVEAVTNAVEHAYPPGTGGQVHIRGRLHDSGEVELTVRDFGRWQAVDPQPGLRGRGLVLIRRSMHRVALDRAADGTTVVMRRTLHSDAVLDPVGPADRSAGERADHVEFSVRTHPGAAGERVRVVVAGPVDMSSAPRLRAALTEAGRGGALPLLVDLDEVTHLASSGIQLLADLAAAFQAEPGEGPRFAVVATPGSIARHALDITGLDHLIVDEGPG
jgi:anti-anti-sigma factor